MRLMAEFEPSMPFAIDQGRSSLYYTPKGESAESLALMQRIDELFLKHPFYGARQMGLQAIYRAPRTSDPHPEHRVYPYLLKDMSINRSNQVWCADISVPQQAA